MIALYWTLFAVVGWCYIGYPVLMEARARLRPRPIRRAPAPSPLPRVTVVVAARNAGPYLSRRLENLLTQDYPLDHLTITVVSNGSTDATEVVAKRYMRRTWRVKSMVSRAEDGKAGALNAGVASTAAEVIVFADARQTFDPQAIRRLVEPLEDPEVGAVTGRLLVRRGDQPALEGVRWYWGWETRLRTAESICGSVVGVTGAIYAIRREDFEPFPPGLILDDVYLPMRLAMRGRRVVMAPEAIAFDEPSAEPGAEFGRKRRTMVGNIQLISAIPGLLSPVANPLFVRYVSHKLLRLLTPICFLGMLVLGAAIPGGLYRGAFLLQAAVYLLGLLGLVLPLRLLSLPSAFVLIHAAILSALYRWRQDASDVWSNATAAHALSPPA